MCDTCAVSSEVKEVDIYSMFLNFVSDAYLFQVKEVILYDLYLLQIPFFSIFLIKKLSIFFHVFQTELRLLYMLYYMIP